jgi:hypothetical protein
MSAAAEDRERQRNRARSTRKRAVRARTLSVVNSKKELIALRLQRETEGAASRPKTRGDCLDGARPCPFVGCAHHLYLDVNAKNGSIKLNFPELEPDAMSDSCALDIADQGEATLERVGDVLNITPQAVRLIELRIAGKLARVREGLRRYLP